MKKPVTRFRLLVAITFMLAISHLAFISAVLAEDPGAPSPTEQEEATTSSEQGEVQERGIRQMPIGGISGGTVSGQLEVVGFSCDAGTHTCKCRKSKVGDCKLMLALVCGGDLSCRGSSQTCTCPALR
ncbi:MAG: hypothetical protein R3B83_03295 [Nitrospirales bacterium]|nr:hypothetical protein [Nitrospira sp.]MDR4486539.1 hypothetical protein [Nitrospirales bacterium]